MDKVKQTKADSLADLVQGEELFVIKFIEYLVYKYLQIYGRSLNKIFVSTRKSMKSPDVHPGDLDDSVQRKLSGVDGIGMLFVLLFGTIKRNFLL